MSEELFAQVVLNLPNFVFGGLGVFVLYKINERLISILDRLCESCGEDEHKADKSPS